MEQFGSGDEVGRNADSTEVDVVGKPEHGILHAGQTKTFDLYGKSLSDVDSLNYC